MRISDRAFYFWRSTCRLGDLHVGAGVGTYTSEVGFTKSGFGGMQGGSAIQFWKKKSLKEISADLSPDELTAIIGGSGSGMVLFCFHMQL